MTPNLATVEWLHSTIWWIRHPDPPLHRQARPPPHPGRPRQRPDHP